ncbi:hypothetical protein D7V97_41775 [Corallococcus sp. CA053C]|nr:hypothetical protein D7V97_41775 [Corallococcus sp. CA053C]
MLHVNQLRNDELAHGRREAQVDVALGRDEHRQGHQQLDVHRRIAQEGERRRGPAVKERQQEERQPAHQRQGEDAPAQGKTARTGRKVPPSGAEGQASLDEREVEQ